MLPSEVLIAEESLSAARQLVTKSRGCHIKLSWLPVRKVVVTVCFYEKQCSSKCWKNWCCRDS